MMGNRSLSFGELCSYPPRGISDSIMTRSFEHFSCWWYCSCCRRCRCRCCCEHVFLAQFEGFSQNSSKFDYFRFARVEKILTSQLLKPTHAHEEKNNLSFRNSTKRIKKARAHLNLHARTSRTHARAQFYHTFPKVKIERMASLSTLRCCIVSSSSSVQNKNLGRHQKYQRTRLRAKRDDDEKNDENSKLPEFEVRIQNLCDSTFFSRHRRQSDGGEDRILGESLNQSFFIEKFRFLPSSSSLFVRGAGR